MLSVKINAKTIVTKVSSTAMVKGEGKYFLEKIGNGLGKIHTNKVMNDKELKNQGPILIFIQNRSLE